VARLYSNITLHGVSQADAAGYLTRHGDVALVTPEWRASVVVFHADLSRQEDLAARLSRHFNRPALLLMGFNDRVLLYQLYETGERTDEYVSTPHQGLELDGPAPPGDAGRLCAAFGMDRQVARVERILRKEAGPDHPHALAVNRHGDLARALGLPVFAAGSSFELIELGELPHDADLSPEQLVRTG
jgi:hypothetical protein